jgi:hypothetical protein
VDSVQKGSFLSPLMTLLYQLPASQQTALRTALLTWMISAKPSFHSRFGSEESVSMSAMTKTGWSTPLMIQRYDKRREDLKNSAAYLIDYGEAVAAS